MPDHNTSEGRYRRTDSGGGLTVVGLFAGVGGLERGLEDAGHTTLRLCEVDPSAAAVLREHFPRPELHDDVRTFRMPDNIGVLAAGFPCTDLSQAGKTAGINGSESGLIAGVLDRVEKKRRHRRPDWLLIENVPFLLQLGRGAGIRYLTERIAELGYRWAYRVVDTRAFGIPQRRRRVILVAGLRHDPRCVLFADETDPASETVAQDVPPTGFYWTEGNTGIGWAPDAVPTLKGGSSLSIPSPPAIWLSDRIVTPHIEDAERLQGFPPGWTDAAARTAGSDRPRWKLVGNAVSVPVSRWVGSRLADPGEIVLEDVPFDRRRWSDAAWGEKQSGQSVVHAVEASHFPVRQEAPSVMDFLESPTADLSPRATTGFLSRLLESRLRQRRLEPFIQTLRDHALDQGAAAGDLPAAAFEV